jgi:hypothetical protein
MSHRGLIIAINDLAVAFDKAGLRKPVAITMPSEEEVDQIAYLMRGFAVFTARGTCVTINGIEINAVKGGDKVSE